MIHIIHGTSYLIINNGKFMLGDKESSVLEMTPMPDKQPIMSCEEWKTTNSLNDKDKRLNPSGKIRYFKAPGKLLGA